MPTPKSTERPGRNFLRNISFRNLRLRNISFRTLRLRNTRFRNMSGALPLIALTIACTDDPAVADHDAATDAALDASAGGAGGASTTDASSDATTDGSPNPDAATDAATTCECKRGDSCVDGDCAEVPYLLVQFIQLPNDELQYYACAFAPGGFGEVELATQGECSLFQEATRTMFMGAVGDITVSGAKPGTFTMIDEGGCLNGPIQGTLDLYDPGQTLEFSSMGSANFPPYSASLTAPGEALGSPPPTLTRGEDYSVELGAAQGSGRFMLVAYAGGNKQFVRCIDENADNTILVSASLTAQLDESITTLDAIINRSSFTTPVETDSAIVELSLLHRTTTPINFVP